MDFSSHFLQILLRRTQLRELPRKHILLKLQFAKLSIVNLTHIVAIFAAT